MRSKAGSRALDDASPVCASNRALATAGSDAKRLASTPNSGLQPSRCSTATLVSTAVGYLSRASRNVSNAAAGATPHTAAAARIGALDRTGSRSTDQPGGGGSSSIVSQPGHTPFPAQDEPRPPCPLPCPPPCRARSQTRTRPRTSLPVATMLSPLPRPRASARAKEKLPSPTRRIFCPRLNPPGTAREAPAVVVRSTASVVAPAAAAVTAGANAGATRRSAIFRARRLDSTAALRRRAAGQAKAFAANGGFGPDAC